MYLPEVCHLGKFPGRYSSLTFNTFAIKAGCKKPEDVATTKIRKYTATVVQILALNEGELEWLSSHLGHNIDVHKEVYRIHENTIEIAKVSKLLIAMDDGNLHRHQGKSLQEIEIGDIPILEDDLEEDDEVLDTETMNDATTSGAALNEEMANDEESSSSDVQQIARRVQTNRIDDSSSDDQVEEKQVKKRKVKKQKRKATAAEYDDSSSDDQAAKKKVKKQRKGKVAAVEYDDSDSMGMEKKRAFSKRRWSNDETTVFTQILDKYLKKNQMPPRHALMEVVNRINRTLPQVRTRANNIIHKKQK